MQLLIFNTRITYSSTVLESYSKVSRYKVIAFTGGGLYHLTWTWTTVKFELENAMTCNLIIFPDSVGAEDTLKFEWHIQPQNMYSQPYLKNMTCAVLNSRAELQAQTTLFKSVHDLFHYSNTYLYSLSSNTKFGYYMNLQAS